LVYLDILTIFVKSLVSMCLTRGRLADRSWRAEFLFRFLKALFSASKEQPITWLRDRQEALNSPDEKHKVRFENEHIQGVDCLWCKPTTSATASTIIVYFHGGGYVFGSTATYKNVFTELALASNAWVLGVDYRLGPEHHFPAAQDDCLAVSQHILDQYSDFRVILAGDSAGGGLVLDSHNSLLERDVQSKPAALLLISPWLDPANQLASMSGNEHTDVLDRQLVEQWRQLYMEDTPTDHPRVNFRDMPCQDLVPIYIQAASDEIFIDQIRAFSKRVQAAGVSLKLDEYAGLFHDFQVLTPLLPEAKQAVADIGRYVKGSE
jgi:acetyl esterase/lipase